MTRKSVRVNPESLHLPACWALGILLAATLILFAPFLNPWGYKILSKAADDLANQSLWWRKFGFGELAKGHLALWNPRLFCGAPFFGDFQSALLYPPNWLYLVLPLPFAVNFGIALHVFLGGVFTYFWILKRGSHSLSALTAGFLFMFGGAYFIRIVPGHLPNLCEMVWIPFILLAIDGYRLEQKFHWVLLGIAGFAMQVFAGHVQYLYYTAIFTGVYAVCTLPAQKKMSFLYGFVLMGLGGGLIGAVQVLAGWDAAGESLRNHKLPIDIVDIADMTPERLWCLVWPNFFGHWGDYWGGGFYWEGVVILGLTGFVLALFGLNSPSQPQKKFFSFTALFLTLLAVGKRTPLFVAFYHWFPLFASFRGVGKVDILISLCLIALAAMGLDQVLKDPAQASRWIKPLGIGLSVMGALTLIFVGASFFNNGALFAKFASHAEGMALSLLRGSLVLGTLYLLCRMIPNRPQFRLALVALACLEPFLFAWSTRPYFDYQAIQAKADVVEKLYQSDPGDYRVLGDSGRYRVLADSNNYTLGTQGFDIWGDDPVVPNRYAKFAAAVEQCDADTAFMMKSNFNHFTSALGLLRLRYTLGVKGDGLTADKTPWKVAPRAFFADHWTLEPMDQAIQNSAKPGFDWGKNVYLETEPGISTQPGPLQSQVQVRDLTSDEMEITATLNKPAVLVITDNYSRSWRATALASSSQQTFKVLPADGFLRGIPLQAGSQQFLLEYRPAAFEAGKWISFIGLALYLMLCGFALPGLFRHRT